MLRVLIADDHPIVRKGLVHIVAEARNKYLIDEARNGYEALDKIRKETYDLILLDISMPDLNGLDVLKQIKYENNNVPVLILSIHSEDQYAIRAFKAGASGYVTKQSAPEELLKAIKKIINGGKYVSASLAEILVEELENTTIHPLYKTLSDREYQIMIMLATGKTNKEIAKELCISIKTVSTYKARILKKMNMKNNAQITNYVTQNNLLYT